MLFSVGQTEIHLRDYLYILKKRRSAAILFFVLMVILGGIYTVRASVLYQSTATILIERENPNIVDFNQVMNMDASASDYYQTQFLMLKSESLIGELIREEDMLEDPYFKGMQKGFLRRYLKKVPFLPSWFEQFMQPHFPEKLFLRKMLDVDPVPNTRLVKVSVKHVNPERAKVYANSLVQLFIQRNLRDRYMLSSQATQLISGQVEELKRKVYDAEVKLQQYKEDNDLVSIPSIHKTDEFIQEAKLELVKIQAEEAKLAKRYLPAHPKRIHIRSQIEGLAEKIKEEEQSKLDLGRVAIEYGQLAREHESSKQIYQALLSRLEETTSEANTQASNIIVVDKARAPVRPFKPQPFFNMVVFSFLGLFGGIMLTFFLEYLDSTIKIPDDVEKAVGLEMLGIIPKAGKTRKGPLKGEVSFDTSKPSPVAESFRALRTALLFKLRKVPGCRVLMITSPNPSEGKTTVSLNLAAAFQQNHLKVLLIDGDLRKPRLNKALNLDQKNGLMEVLEENLSLEEAIHENLEGLGYDFLSSGAHSSKPTEALGSEKMKVVIEKLREIYDIIIIDSSPYLAVADTVVLSEYAHGIVVSTKYHQTDKRHLKEIKRRFSHALSKVLGVVINQVSVREKDHYYQQHYYYGYGESSPKK